MRKCARLFCSHLPGCCGRAEGYLASAASSSRGRRPTRGALHLEKPQMQDISKRVCFEAQECDSPGSERHVGVSLTALHPGITSTCWGRMLVLSTTPDSCEPCAVEQKMLTLGHVAPYVRSAAAVTVPAAAVNRACVRSCQPLCGMVCNPGVWEAQHTLGPRDSGHKDRRGADSWAGLLMALQGSFKRRRHSVAA